MIYQVPLLRLTLLVLIWFSVGAFLTLSCVATAKLRATRRRRQAATILLELTPPAAYLNTLQATEEFFTVLSRVVNLQSFKDLVKGTKPTIALEVVSTRRQGIRYVVRLPIHDKLLFLHHLSAAAPTVEVREVADHLPDKLTLQTSHIVELKQSGQRSYALRHAPASDISDPIAYLTNAMSQLDDEEQIVLQLVLAPISSWRMPNDGRIIPKDLQLLAVPADIVAATNHKGQQPLFYASIRALIHTNSQAGRLQRSRGIISALATFSYEGYQSLQPRFDLTKWQQRYRLFTFRYRLPALFNRNSCVLASSEVAALYHFPYGTANKTEDLVTEQATALPVPLAVKNQQLSLYLGESNYRGRTVPIGLSATERQRHVYIVGGTGNGKSTLLQYALVQDMQAGKGVALLDPHGDLATTLLSYVPENRTDDVIYFNPADISYPIGLNLLELPEGLSPDELLQEKDLVTEAIVSMFRKIFSTNDTSGHRIEYVLRNAVQTALTLEAPTLFTVYQLLNDASYRKKVVSGLDNADLKLFWKEFGKAGSFQQVSMAAGITAKIGRFLFSASARRILEQPQSTINFESLMDSGKILICNLAKGQLGEDTSELFGIMVLAKLQLAALRRARRPATERNPFYVYVDEFQNFATPSFVQLLSEARKYGLFMTMAEQSTSQQSDPRMIDIIFANVGTVVCFRTSSQRDEQLLQPLLSPHVAPGTIARLPSFTFYIRIATEMSQAPFSGRTIVMAPADDLQQAEFCILTSRMKYGRPTQRVSLPEPTESDINMQQAPLGQIGGVH